VVRKIGNRIGQNTAVNAVIIVKNHQALPLDGYILDLSGYMPRAFLMASQYSGSLSIDAIFGQLYGLSSPINGHHLS
jgi:hypothetical protein